MIAITEIIYILKYLKKMKFLIFHNITVFVFFFKQMQPWRHFIFLKKIKKHNDLTLVLKLFIDYKFSCFLLKQILIILICIYSAGEGGKDLSICGLYWTWRM